MAIVGDIWLMAKLVHWCFHQVSKYGICWLVSSTRSDCFVLVGCKEHQQKTPRHFRKHTIDYAPILARRCQVISPRPIHEVLCIPFFAVRKPKSRLTAFMMKTEQLDTHERPPDSVKNVYKFYQRLPKNDLDEDLDILDFGRGLSPNGHDKIMHRGSISSSDIDRACCQLGELYNTDQSEKGGSRQIFEVKGIPGKLHGCPNSSFLSLMAKRSPYRTRPNPARCSARSTLEAAPQGPCQPTT